MIPTKIYAWEGTLKVLTEGSSPNPTSCGGASALGSGLSRGTVSHKGGLADEHMAEADTPQPYHHPPGRQSKAKQSR